jgi:cystathionine beta-synthase
MMERGFLEVKTFRDIIASRAQKQKLISVSGNQSVADAVALMKKYEIEHIPVFEGEHIIGSISENGVFQKLFTDHNFSNEKISNVLETPYPLVDFNSPVEKISKLISRENGAVLSKDEAGVIHIITKYDILQALAK